MLIQAWDWPHSRSWYWTFAYDCGTYTRGWTGVCNSFCTDGWYFIGSHAFVWSHGIWTVGESGTSIISLHRQIQNECFADSHDGLASNTVRGCDATIQAYRVSADPHSTLSDKWLTDNDAIDLALFLSKIKALSLDWSPSRMFSDSSPRQIVMVYPHGMRGVAWMECWKRFWYGHVLLYQDGWGRPENGSPDDNVSM